MNNIISYALFGDPKFWGAVPAALLIARLTYPHFHPRIYVSKEFSQDSRMEFITKICVLDRNITYEIIEEELIRTKGTVYRMKPLWENNTGFLICRDLDAFPLPLEVSGTNRFLGSQQYIHSFRSHHLHTTSLLAGLCAFNASALRQNKKIPQSFKEYLKLGESNTQCPNWQWGCDQELLRRAFYGQDKSLIQHTVDMPVGKAPLRIHGYDPIVLLPKEYENQYLSDCFTPIFPRFIPKIHYLGEKYWLDKKDYEFLFQFEHPVISLFHRVLKDTKLATSCLG